MSENSQIGEPAYNVPPAVYRLLRVVLDGLVEIHEVTSPALPTAPAGISADKLEDWQRLASPLNKD